jgi:hypothetical protein
MRYALAVVALTVATLALRLWGIDHGLPHSKEADSNIALHVELLRRGADEPDPQHNDAQYPIVLAGSLSLLPSTERPLAERSTLQDHLRAASAVYVETRTWGTLLGVLLVPLTYAFARRFVSRGWSLLASALVATSFLDHFFSQQARPHAAASAMFLLAVLAAMRLARRPTWDAYALAALASAVSIGVLQSGLATLLPLFAAMAIAPLFAIHEPAQKLYLRYALAFGLVLVVLTSSFLLFYPYLYYEGREAAYGAPAFEGTRLVWGDHRLDLGDWNGGGFLRVLRTLLYYEPALLVLLVVAAAALALRELAIRRPLVRWADFWVAAAFALPYLLAIGLFRNTFERFTMPLLPYAAVFAAWGLSWWSERIGPRVRAAPVAVAALALAFSAYACARLSWLRSRDDTLERAAAWLAEQPDALASATYVTPFFDLPLPRSRESLQPSGRPAAILSRWSQYQKRVGPDVVPPPAYDLRYLVPRPDLGFPQARMELDAEAYVAALGAGYFVLDMSRQVEHPSFPALRAAVAARGKLVHRSAPEDEGATAAFGFPFEDEILPEWPNVIARALRIAAVGPVVEIYRID